jgi:hypothetical protein
MRSRGWLWLVLLLSVSGVASAETDAARYEARTAAERTAQAEVEAGRFLKAAEVIEAFMKAHPHPSNLASYGSPAKLAESYRARAAVAERAKGNGREQLRALLAVAAFPSTDGLSLSESGSGPGYVLEVLGRLRAVDAPLDALLARKVKVVPGEVEGLSPMELGLVIDGVTRALRELGIAADTGAGDDLFTISAVAAEPMSTGLGAGMVSCTLRVTGRWTSGTTLVLSAVDLTVTKPAFSPELARQNAAGAVGKAAPRKLLKAVLDAPPVPAR